MEEFTEITVAKSKHNRALIRTDYYKLTRDVVNAAITLSACAWREGQAIDAHTCSPVHGEKLRAAIGALLKLEDEIQKESA